MHNNYTNNNIIRSLEYNNNYTTDNRDFALCESCFWSATIFKSGKKQQENKTNSCPVCFNYNSISLIPLTKERS